MGAAVQNFIISQGEGLLSQIIVQLPGQPFNVTGTTAIGSQTVLSGDSRIVIGDSITGTGIQPNTIITAIGSGTITISIPAIVDGTAQLTVSAFAAVNLTGVSFLFSAKTDDTQADAFALPDGDSISQGVYEFNWVELTTPTLGYTWGFNISETITQQMVAGPWYYLIRMLDAPGLSTSKDILTGVILITAPASNRIL